MSKLDSITTTLNFKGAQTELALQENPDLVRVVWELASHNANAWINIYVVRRITDSDPVEWSMNIASPLGRRTVLLKQSKPSTAVLITAQ